MLQSFKNANSGSFTTGPDTFIFISINIKIIQLVVYGDTVLYAKGAEILSCIGILVEILLTLPTLVNGDDVGDIH